MEPALAEADDRNTLDLRAEIQGAVTFYHSLSTPGYWFSAGELEAMIDNRSCIELPEPKAEYDSAEEFAHGPRCCPRCGEATKLFEMKSYLNPEVRMKACHVCHGRWIGHCSLELLMETMRFGGLLGPIRRLWSKVSPGKPSQPRTPGSSSSSTGVFGGLARR